MEIGLIFSWVIKSSIMASVLASLILLVKNVLRSKLDAKWQYAIWMLLIIRLLIPYDIQSPWSIYSLLPNNSVTIPIVNQSAIRMPDIKTQITDVSEKGMQMANEKPIINQSSTKAEVPISKNLFNGWILAILWLIGVLILSILAIVTNMRFYFKVRREPLATNPVMLNLMQECARKLGIRKSLPIICMNGIDTPCLYGIISPKLLLPKPLANRLNEENIIHIFIHELSHYKRNDILINWLAVAAQIVHWFNPLIWYSFARMREDCELACDADTLSFLMPEEYQSYGLSIISLLTPAQSTWLPGTTGFFGNKNNHQIRRRIKMIKFFKKPTSKWTLTAIVIFISLGLLGFTNTISNATAETGANKVISTTSSTGKKADVTIPKSPEYTFVEPDKPVPKDWPTPAAKDITREKAASYASDKIMQMYGDNLDGSRATVMFSKSKSQGNIILKDMWVMNFQTADGNKIYWCNVDSVTGEIYNLSLFDKSKDPLNIGVEPENMTPAQKQALQKASDKEIAQQNIIRKDNRLFIEVARDIVNSHLLNGRTIVSSKFNSIGGVNSRLVLQVAVSMSDGSGYLIELDGYTREFVDFQTRPDGV